MIFEDTECMESYISSVAHFIFLIQVNFKYINNTIHLNVHKFSIYNMEFIIILSYFLFLHCFCSSLFNRQREREENILFCLYQIHSGPRKKVSVRKKVAAGIISI